MNPHFFDVLRSARVISISFLGWAKWLGWILHSRFNDPAVLLAFAWPVRVFRRRYSIEA